MSSSHLEKRFESYWGTHYPHSPQPIREYMFHTDQNWRFDFVWLNHMIALEIQGGSFTRGRHSRGAGQMTDYEKVNAANVMGWRVFYANTSMLSHKKLPILADQIHSIVSSAIFMADLDKSRWIAILRNLSPKEKFEWHGVYVERQSSTAYSVLKNSEKLLFKKGSRPLGTVRGLVLAHIMGEA